MDKNVEVSKDQNTIVISGTRYKAVVTNECGGRVSNCDGCDVVATENSRDYCSCVPCTRIDRTDRTEVVFKVQL